MKPRRVTAWRYVKADGFSSRRARARPGGRMKTVATARHAVNGWYRWAVLNRRSSDVIVEGEARTLRTAKRRADRELEALGWTAAR